MSDEFTLVARGSAPPASWATDLLRFERLLIRLSARFVSLQPAEVDAAIDDAMKAIVDALDIDRCALTRLDPQGTFTRENSWTRPGLKPVSLGPAVLNYPWGLSVLRRGEPVVFSSTAELPPEAALDRASFERAGLRSFVGMPLMVAGEMFGALHFACLFRQRTWPDELLGRLRLVAEIFGNAMARKHAQQELDQMLAFEQMLAEITASLVSLPYDEVDAAIEAGLQRTARFLHADRATLWSVSADGQRMSPTHFWLKGGPLPITVNADELPWIVGRLSLGHPVRLRQLEEMPAEAGADRTILRQRRMVSMLAVPLRIRDTVIGAFSLSTVDDSHEWPSTYVPRVRLLGEVFATALGRKESERRLFAAQEEAAQHRERLAHVVRLHTVGEMSAGIAHEISQPLVAIENYALAARRHAGAGGPADLGKVSALLDKIVAQSSRAGEVMRKLRSMVKRHEFEMNRIDLAETVKDSLRFAEMEGHLHDVTIRLLLAEGLPDVVADDIQIQQVMLNLVRNASDAMRQLPPGATKSLTIEVGSVDTAVFVRVSDSGPGFADGDADRIFEPFYSTKTAGLGVGLSLCRTIVEAQGGRLCARIGDQGGAVLEFTLPSTDEAG